MSEEAAVAKKAPDWERIELDYRAGILSVREMGAAHGISHTAINKRAKRDGWVRDLAAKIKAKADAKIVLRPDAPAKAGFLYVIYLDSGGERFYKIGMSAHFSARFDAHQCASPFDVCVACAYFTSDMRTEERYWHQRFAAQHVKGEWFRLSHADLVLIASGSLLV